MNVVRNLAEYVTVYDAALLRFPGWPLAAAGIVVALAGWLLGYAVPASRAGGRGRGALALRVTRSSGRGTALHGSTDRAEMTDPTSSRMGALSPSSRGLAAKGSVRGSPA